TRCLTVSKSESARRSSMADTPLPVRRFSHVCVAVSSIERSLPFYRDLLGLDVVFDVDLDGPPMELVTGEPGAKGRMVGGLLGGTVVELLQFTHRDGVYERPALGYTNISLTVDDLDAAYAQCLERGVEPQQAPVDIGGVR